MPYDRSKRKAKLMALQQGTLEDPFPFLRNQGANIPNPEVALSSQGYQGFNPTPLGQNILEAAKYFKENPLYGEPQYPFSKQQSEMEAAGMAMDVLDPFATAARELAKARGASPEEAMAAEMAAGLVSPGLGEFLAPMKGAMGGAKAAGFLFPMKAAGGGFQKQMRRALGRGDLADALEIEAKMAKVSKEREHLRPFIESIEQFGEESIAKRGTPLGEELAKVAERIEGEGGIAVKGVPGSAVQAGVQGGVVSLPIEEATDPGVMFHILGHEQGHVLWGRLKSSAKAGMKGATKVEDAVYRAMVEEGGFRTPKTKMGLTTFAGNLTDRMGKPVSLKEAEELADKMPGLYQKYVHPELPHALGGRPTGPAYGLSEVPELVQSVAEATQEERMADFLSTLMTPSGQAQLKPRTKEILSEVMDLF